MEPIGVTLTYQSREPRQRGAMRTLDLRFHPTWVRELIFVMYRRETYTFKQLRAFVRGPRDYPYELGYKCPAHLVWITNLADALGYEIIVRKKQ